MKDRIIFPDIARGIAILIVIMWHTIDYHIAWVDSWALPIFFVIMGMFFRPTVTWREMITKKVCAILLPFLILSIPSFIQYAIQLPIKDFVSRILDPFNCMHGVGWFLICMFWCYIIYYGIHRLTKGNLKYKFLVSLLLSVSFFFLSTLRPSVLFGHRLVLPLFISTSFTSTILIWFGEILRDLLLKERSRNRYVLVASVAMGGVIIFFFGCKGGAMIVNDYYGQPYILWFSNSLLGSIAILEISKYLPAFLSFWGEHSLLMLMIHPYIKRLFLLVLEPTIWFYILVIIVSTIIVYCLSKYLPITEGKYAINKKSI